MAGCALGSSHRRSERRVTARASASTLAAPRPRAREPGRAGAARRRDRRAVHVRGLLELSLGGPQPRDASCRRPGNRTPACSRCRFTWTTGTIWAGRIRSAARLFAAATRVRPRLSPASGLHAADDRERHRGVRRLGRSALAQLQSRGHLRSVPAASVDVVDRSAGRARARSLFAIGLRRRGRTHGATRVDRSAGEQPRDAGRERRPNDRTRRCRADVRQRPCAARCEFDMAGRDPSDDEPRGRLGARIRAGCAGAASARNRRRSRCRSSSPRAELQRARGSRTSVALVPLAQLGAHGSTGATRRVEVQHRRTE